MTTTVKITSNPDEEYIIVCFGLKREMNFGRNV
jgi:hypothetical protein